MEYSTVTSPRWVNAAQTVIECVVTFAQHGEAPFAACAADTTAHGREIFERLVAGDFGPIQGYTPPAAPSHEALVAATVAKAKQMRMPILQILDGMQTSALVTGATVVVDLEPRPLAMVIEDLKTGIKQLPDQVDFSACSTREEMEDAVQNAYFALASSAPTEVQSAFRSLVP
jgi:hypothetical protein